MTELVIPRPGTQPLDYTGVKMSWWGKVSYIARSLEECADIVTFFGEATFKPFQPILLLIPGTEGFLIVGNGVTEASELQDLCITTWGRYLDRLVANDGQIFNFGELREKHGYMNYEDRDAQMRQQLWDYHMEKQRNPVTGGRTKHD